MSTQRSLLLQGPQGAFVVRDRPIPEPGPGEILVKIYAAALNPIDWKVRKYNVHLSSYPAILGLDGAGDVVKIGEGVSNFVPGDKVFFPGVYDSKGATWQQYALADAEFAAKIPSNISYDQATTIPTGLTTPYNAFYQGWGLTLPTKSAGGLGKYAGTPILVIGGSSAVGQFAIQLAKASGFSPIITTSSLKHTDHLKSFGATHILNRHNPLSTLAGDVAKITSTLPYAYDAVALPDAQQAVYDLLSDGGKLATVLPPRIPNSIRTKEGDGKVVHQVQAMRTIPGQEEKLAEGYRNWTEWLQTGLIKPQPLEVLPNGLNGIADGLQRLEDDKISGIKLVAHPWD
ncbi:GroES-like protein [Pluteus cervinus]|uniref:GroES-like protein n=1 Tax=Pluteus cervinus TaxID=181527 RepID=A0ACD3AXF1_9AGAR|nr:GroES-like protein [Pluteus cervinus]